MKILVLTSRENFVWLSMQEVIPYIEHTWKTLSSKSYEVQFLNIDQHPLSTVLTAALQADRIVSTCFNYKMCKFILFLRKNAKLSAPMIHHVHNMATIAFWPFRFWADKQIFQKNDLFVVSCRRDIENMRLVAPEAQTFLVPFNFIDQSLNIPGKGARQIENLLFIGRISPQKNLHVLILAYSRLLKKLGDRLPTLLIYGKEDHLGSPNMNLKNRTYLNFLLGLVEQLELCGKVQFMGHRDRSEIKAKLENDFNLLITPSLHSDENFGMVVLQALLCNNDCLISDWGGHSDFKTHFSDLVDLIPVRPSVLGPSVHPQELADCIEHKLSKGSREVKAFELPKHYWLEEAHQALQELLQTEGTPEPLIFSEIADQILEKIMGVFAKENKTQIFESFADPLFHRMSSVYMNQYSRLSERQKGSSEVVPWIEETNDEWHVKDPHRGFFVMKKAEISEKELLEAGYLF